jgi:hypothetical protein
VLKPTSVLQRDNGDVSTIDVFHLVTQRKLPVPLTIIPIPLQSIARGDHRGRVMEKLGVQSTAQLFPMVLRYIAWPAWPKFRLRRKKPKRRPSLKQVSEHSRASGTRHSKCAGSSRPRRVQKANCRGIEEGERKGRSPFRGFEGSVGFGGLYGREKDYLLFLFLHS